MKMFIPEIGSRITLSEDWMVVTNTLDYSSRILLAENDLVTETKREDGYVLYYNFTIPKGTTLSIKQVKLKRGKSMSNGVEFYIPKPKQPDKRFGTVQFKVLLPDLDDLEFELAEKNEETFNFAMDFLSVLREENGGHTNTYREIEKIILNNKTMLSFSPQQKISSFAKSVSNRFEKYDYTGYQYNKEMKDIHKKFNTYNRRYKISKVLDD
jgi:hypothetical protein